MAHPEPPLSPLKVAAADMKAAVVAAQAAAAAQVAAAQQAAVAVVQVREV